MLHHNLRGHLPTDLLLKQLKRLHQALQFRQYRSLVSASGRQAMAGLLLQGLGMLLRLLKQPHAPSRASSQAMKRLKQLEMLTFERSQQQMLMLEQSLQQLPLERPQ